MTFREFDRGAQRPDCQQRTSARVAAVVLAAGQSSRMGASNKLLVPVRGVPMVTQVVNAALASRCASVTVVTGYEAARVREALAGKAVTFAHNPDFAQGLSASLQRGLRALREDVGGAIVLLADMPRITAAHLDALIAEFETQTGIIVPTLAGRRGNPVLWPRRFFAEMRSISGDTGARALIDLHRDETRSVELCDDAIFFDVDTPAELAETGRA